MTTPNPEPESKTPPETYTLTVTAQQAQLLAYACETVSRLYGGQFDAIADIFLANARTVTKADELPPETYRKRDDLRRELKSAERYFAAPCGARHGITSRSVHDASRILWDMYEVLRHQLRLDAGEKPGGGFCAGYPSYHWQKDTPLITIEKYDQGADCEPNYPVGEITTRPAKHSGVTFTQPPISSEEDKT